MKILLIPIFLVYSSADSSILIQKACTINPGLDMCRPSINTGTKFGSLLRLPSHSDGHKSSQESSQEEETAVSEDIEMSKQYENNETSSEIDSSTVSVFISQFCVDQRNRFVQKCHGEVDSSEMLFCKTYPASCSTIGNVIPIMTYCARNYKKYRPLCTSQEANAKAEQFCFAFEQFCLPMKNNSEEVKRTPSPVLQRCENVVKEARKVCNPMPNVSDEFNYVRCTRFVKKCRKFVDWI
ncbi:hypothetical protein PENTCL1PPCAC_56 [Pristionchus entomophagus]|uniref:Uncharacterized protein n=1 Tax=Pristionchus entomophagus TaxID=358040 RepID=A0AAV5S5U7_9BILA|nr:hypothetical protein PENTCL1PPCAC_56 [Pristionchus entomophagus]